MSVELAIPEKGNPSRDISLQLKYTFSYLQESGL